MVVAGGGLAIATGNINPVDTLTGVNNNTAPSTHSATKGDNDATSTSATYTDAQSTNDNESAEVASDGNSNADTSSSDTNANGSTQSTTGATRWSNSNSDTSTASNSSASQASTPAQSATAHQHAWSPVYKTVHHDAVTTTVTEYHYICNTCGAILDGGIASDHLLSTHHSSYRTNVPFTESKIVKTAYDERVIDHYVCSCGATK